MVLLAKSYKPGGRCIAGRRAELVKKDPLKKTVVKLGGWVRPVANDGTGKGALTADMYTYEDGSEAKVLDIVKVPVIKAFPLDGQPENYVIDENEMWKKVGTLSAKCLPRIKDEIESVWNDTTTHSHTVTPEYDEQGLVSQSLCLIQPSNFMITLSNDYNEYDEKYKTKIVASFDYSGISYSQVSVTCPAVKLILKNRYPNEGKEAVTLSLNKGDNYILCMSLSPRFGHEDLHYKLVATAFDFDGYLQRNYAS